MELAETATIIFITGTISYRMVKHWRSVRRWQKGMGKDFPLTLSFSLPEEVSGEHVAVLAFNYRGELVKKIPQAHVTVGRGRKCRFRYVVPHGAETLCVLAGTGAFSVSGIETRSQAQLFHKQGVRLWIGEGDVSPAKDYRMPGNPNATDNPPRKDKLSLELKELVNTGGIRPFPSP